MQRSASFEPSVPNISVFWYHHYHTTTIITIIIPAIITQLIFIHQANMVDKT